VRKTFLIPSIADLIFLCVFVIILVVFRSGDFTSALLSDGDTAHHIRAGDVTLQMGRVPRHDMFSFITPPLEWVAHSWLAEVLMALVYKVFGLTGIVLVFATLIAFIFRLLFCILRRNSENILLVTSIAILAAASSWLHWHARPHVFSVLLALVWYHLLDDFQYREKNRLYWLPAIYLVWINLHGGFIIGPILLVIYFVGNLFEYVSSNLTEKRPILGRLKTFVTIGLLCVLASFVNPQGFQILLFPFKLTSDDFLVNIVQEHLSPDFHGLLPFKYYLLLVIATLAVSRFALNWIETMLTVLFTYMALYSARYIPLFAVILAPIWLRLLDRLLQDSPGWIAEQLKVRSRNLTLSDARAVGGVWAAACVVAVCGLGMSGTLRFEFNPKTFPVKAVEFMRQANIAGNMFNDPKFGDYIILYAWPQYRVFGDGRADMYGVNIGRDFLNLQSAQPGWEEVTHKYGITWVIDRSRSRLAEVLRDRPDWRLIYADETAVLYVKAIDMHRRLIEQYGATVALPKVN